MNKLILSCLLVVGAAVLQGCIAIPPLIQVQHRDNGSSNLNDSRLDAIEKRLERIEQKLAEEKK